MSAKSNRLKNRMRILREQQSCREKELGRRQLAIAETEKLIKEKTLLRIIVADMPEYVHHTSNEFVLQVYFRPEELVTQFMREPMANITYEAARVAHDARDKIYRALLDEVERRKEKPFATRTTVNNR